jgi:hypothetical protein
MTCYGGRGWKSPERQRLVVVDTEETKRSGAETDNG